MNNSDLDEKTKTLATKAQLKTDKDKIEKLQTYESSLFIGQSYFINDGSLNSLIFKFLLQCQLLFQAMYAYELDAWSQDLNTAFTLKDCLFGAVKLTKNNNPDKYNNPYSGFGIGFDSCSLFSILNS